MSRASASESSIAGTPYLLPVVVIFLFTQKYFMGSGLGSSVKG